MHHQSARVPNPLDKINHIGYLLVRIGSAARPASLRSISVHASGRDAAGAGTQGSSLLQGLLKDRGGNTPRPGPGKPHTPREQDMVRHNQPQRHSPPSARSRFGSAKPFPQNPGPSRERARCCAPDIRSKQRSPLPAALRRRTGRAIHARFSRRYSPARRRMAPLARHP